MSFGKMNTFIELIETSTTKDTEGFTIKGDTILASLRAYKEDKHGNEAWKNRAVFSSATSLFRFRKISGINVNESMVIVCDSGRYNIVSVENVRGRNMYIEVLAEKSESSKGG